MQLTQSTRIHNRFLAVVTAFLVSIAFLCPTVPLLSANLRRLCFFRFVFSQTGDCRYTSPSMISGIDRICGFGWQEPMEFTGGKEILVTADRFSTDGSWKTELRKLDSGRSQDGVYFHSHITFWTVSEISTTLDIPVAVYQLQVHGLNDQPGPVILQVLVEHRLLGWLRFDKDDGSWETKCLLLHPMYWPKSEKAEPKLTIGIRFTNDGGEGGNRDAAVAWLRLVPVLSKEAR
jgi:hypothetical protein